MQTLPPSQPVSVTRTAGLATASLVLGILSVTCFSLLAGIPAVLLGALALKRIARAAGALGGKKQALAGLIMGCVSLLLLPLVIGLCLLGSRFMIMMDRPGGGQPKAVCMSHLKLCALAIEEYAEAHAQTRPVAWADVQKYLDDMPAPRETLHCPADPDGAVSYEIVNPGRPLVTDGHPETTIVVREIHANHRGRRVVGYADGHVELQ